MFVALHKDALSSKAALSGIMEDLVGIGLKYLQVEWPNSIYPDA